MNRFLTVVILTTLSAFNAHADVTLTPGHAYGVMKSANQVFIAFAERTAIDDEWVESLRAMPPQAMSGNDRAKAASALEGVRQRLNIVRDMDGLEPLAAFAADISDTDATFYREAGRILDALVEQVLYNDSVALVANYYLPDDEDSKHDINGATAQIALMTRRLDAYIEENEL